MTHCPTLRSATLPRALRLCDLLPPPSTACPSALSNRAKNNRPGDTARLCVALCCGPAWGRTVREGCRERDSPHCQAGGVTPPVLRKRVPHWQRPGCQAGVRAELHRSGTGRGLSRARLLGRQAGSRPAMPSPPLLLGVAGSWRGESRWFIHPRVALPPCAAKPLGRLALRAGAGTGSLHSPAPGPDSSHPVLWGKAVTPLPSQNPADRAASAPRRAPPFPSR